MISLKKTITCLILLCVFMSPQAQTNKEQEIKELITVFFNGLQSGDTLILSKTLRVDAVLQTAYYNEQGESILRSEKRSDFLKAIAAKNPEDIWEEKLLSYTINIDRNMAHVWTPYEFYFNTNFSHCGVNSFQLFYDGKKWQIIYLIDTRKRETCKE